MVYKIQALNIATNQNTGLYGAGLAVAVQVTVMV